MSKDRIVKPKTKEAFAAMLMQFYGYDDQLANECANIVAGHGAFNPVLHDEETMTALQTIKNLGYSAEQLRAAMEAINEN